MNTEHGRYTLYSIYQWGSSVAEPEQEPEPEPKPAPVEPKLFCGARAGAVISYLGSGSMATARSQNYLLNTNFTIMLV